MSLHVLATGLSGPPGELDPLVAAGHRVTVERSLDQPGRCAWTEPELVAAAKDVEVILASHLELISAGVMQGAPRLEQILAFGRGEIPAHVVNPEVVAHRRAHEER